MASCHACSSLWPNKDVEVRQTKAKNPKELNKHAEEIADKLIKSDWQPFCSRPRGDYRGYYIIYRWYEKNKTWLAMYVYHGDVGSSLDYMWSGKCHEAISRYITSFPLEQRKLLWIKWVKGTGFDCDLNEVVQAIRWKYNHGYRPPFNFLPKPEPVEKKTPAAAAPAAGAKPAAGKAAVAKAPSAKPAVGKAAGGKDGGKKGKAGKTKSILNV